MFRRRAVIVCTCRALIRLKQFVISYGSRPEIVEESALERTLHQVDGPDGVG